MQDGWIEAALVGGSVGVEEQAREARADAGWRKIIRCLLHIRYKQRPWNQLGRALRERESLGQALSQQLRAKPKKRNLIVAVSLLLVHVCVTLWQYGHVGAAGTAQQEQMRQMTERTSQLTGWVLLGSEDRWSRQSFDWKARAALRWHELEKLGCGAAGIRSSMCPIPHRDDQESREHGRGRDEPRTHSGGKGGIDHILLHPPHGLPRITAHQSGQCWRGRRVGDVSRRRRGRL